MGLDSSGSLLSLELVFDEAQIFNSIHKLLYVTTIWCAALSFPLSSLSVRSCEIVSVLELYCNTYATIFQYNCNVYSTYVIISIITAGT